MNRDFISYRLQYHMNTITNMGKAMMIAGWMLAAEQVDAQMALDQTVTGTNGQIYKTIAFANGSSTNNPSYNFTGTKNIDIGTSDSFASQPSFWRSNGSGGGTFVNTSAVGWVTAPTLAPETVGSTTITWDQATALQKTVQTNTNSLGINLSMNMKKALADTNNDGLKDAFINIHAQLPTGTAAQTAGFQIGDIALYGTPVIVNNIDGTTLLTKQISYKKLNNNRQREDSLDGPTGASQKNIVDWVNGSMGTEELDMIQTTVYPNPTTEKIAIKLINNNKVDEYRIYATSGQQLITGKNLNSEQSIDVSKLPAGLYILQIKVDDQLITHKIIKK